MACKEKTAEQGDDLERRLLDLLLKHGILPKADPPSAGGSGEK